MTIEPGWRFGLQPGWLADILINTDSQKKKAKSIYSCGIDVKTTVDPTYEAIPANHRQKLKFKRPKWRPPGGDIHLGLGNANKLLAFC